MNVKRRLALPVTLLLVCTTLAGGITAAPGGVATARASAPASAGNAVMLAATNTPVATKTVTATTTMTATTTTTATLSVTPTVTNPSGLVTVAGSGFAPNEAISIYFAAAPKTVTAAKADAAGNLPATGVTVPYTMKPGTHTIVAVGQTSKRTRRVNVTVAALTPSISLSMALAKPGASVTVNGKGFGAKEQVTLALNGAALSTTPAVITTTNGAFTASFAVPSTLLQGTNTVSALGNQSRLTAISPLQGQLGVAAQFYFAGGMNTATAHSFIQLMNTNAQPASVQMTFYAENGATATKSVTVNPTSQHAVSAGSLGLPSGTFGLYIKSDRQISAQININRDGQDGDNLLGNSGLDKRWYLAEGYTGLTFHESVSILNPGATPSHVVLHLLPFGGRAGKDVPVTVAAHTNSVVDINSALPNQSLSIIADSDQPVVVERTLTFSTNGYGLTTRAGTHTPATSWLFAEGTTVNRFQTFLTILNPNPAPALVTASFFGRTGGSLGSRTLLVAGHSRANLKENDFLSASGIATVLTSDLPVVVERPEYFGSPNGANIAGSDVFGRNGAGVRWSFPGGDTQNNSEFLLLYNPSVQTVKVTETFYGSDGKTMTKTVYVPPTVRYNIDVNATIGGFAPVHGAVLQASGGLGFVAEQTVFAPNHSTLRSTQGLAQ